MKKNIVIVLLIFTVFLSACGLKFERNSDGSIEMELSMDEETLQTRIQQSIRDPLIQDFSVELQNGYTVVSGTRKNAQNDNLDTMRFRLDLGAADGHMTAVITEVMINDFPLHPDWLKTWNENIARNLESSAQKNPNSSFENVTVTTDEVVMTWRIIPEEK